MLKKIQQIHNVNKGNSKNTRKQRKKRKQDETKIEIEIKENQINNSNYDVQPYNDNEITNRKRINDKNAFNEYQHDNEKKEKEDDSEEETDSKMPVLCIRVDADASNSDSNNDRDRENDNDGEQKQRNQVDPMKINSGFLNKSSYKNKDIKYKNNKKKKRKKGRSRVQIPSESDDEYSSKENVDESVSGLPGLQKRNRLDSESENEKNNNNNNDTIDDEVDSYDDMDNKSDNRFQLPQALRSKRNIGEWVENDDYNECDYDGDSDTSSIGDSTRLISNTSKVPNAMPKDTTRRKPKSNESPRTMPRAKPRVLRNEIKAMSGRIFTANINST